MRLFSAEHDYCALSLSIGLGFTQCADLFNIFPDMVKNVFAQNCVAVVFLVSILLNLVLPKNMEAEKVTEKKKTAGKSVMRFLF